MVVRVRRAIGADAGTPELVARERLVALSGEDALPCRTLVAASLPMSKGTALTAVRSADPQACESYLASLDKEWTRTQGERDPQCGNPGGTTPPRSESSDDSSASPESTGCDLGGLGGSAPASLAILGAVVAAIAARRARR